MAGRASYGEKSYVSSCTASADCTMRLIEFDILELADRAAFVISQALTAGKCVPGERSERKNKLV